MQLDDRMKQLLRELGHAINDSVSDSERIAEAISSVRAAGFDIVLKLDATIGLARRQASGRENDDAGPALPGIAAHPGGRAIARRRAGAIEAGNDGAGHQISEVAQNILR